MGPFGGRGWGCSEIDGHFEEGLKHTEISTECSYRPFCYYLWFLRNYVLSRLSPWFAVAFHGCYVFICDYFHAGIRSQLRNVFSFHSTFTFVP